MNEIIKGLERALLTAKTNELKGLVLLVRDSKECYITFGGDAYSLLGTVAVLYQKLLDDYKQSMFDSKKESLIQES